MNYTIKGIKLCFMFTLFLVFQQCRLYEKPLNTDELSAESIPENFEIPEYWNDKSKDSTDLADNWYTTFNDDNLNSLVIEALDSSNLPIIFHLARIDASLAQQKLARSGRSIKIGYNGGYAGYSDTKGTNNYNFTAAGGITWEADLWGKIKAGILASDENVLSEIYNYNYTKQSIASQVASLYFNIGTYNKILIIGDKFLELNVSVKELLKIREDVGIINMKDVHLVESQIYSVKNIIEETKNTLQINVRDLEIILGRYPENKLQINCKLDSLDVISEINDPFSLINRRPDIKSSESKLRALFYLNEQAKLAKYPSLVLSADLGISTIGALVFGTGASLFGPIFNGGALDAKIEEATAIQKQAAANYGLSIINAFNEVETLMNTEIILQQQLIYLNKVIIEKEEAYKILLEQYKIGQIDLFEVIQIQSQWLLKKMKIINLENSIYQTRVQLFLALGGNISQ